MGQVNSRRKKATCLEQVHEQPCVLLKYTTTTTTTTAENPPHQLDETPGGADANDGGRDRRRERFWRFRPFRKRSDKYDLVQAEKECEREAAAHTNIIDDHTSLQHLTVVEIPDHQEAPAAEVHPDAEEQQEEDVLFVRMKPAVRAIEHDRVEEPDEDQSSLQSSEISDIEESSSSEDLPDSEEQQEQDVRQSLDVEPEEQGNGIISCRYKFGPKLGQGGFGSVYEGTRCKDGLKVALKIVEKTPEMRSIKVLGHPKRLPLEIALTFMANKGPRVPQIIQLLDWQDDPDQYIMVLERPFPCMSLANFIDLKGGCLDERTAKHIMQQVVHAANICCERGVFHRDIKLENLLINEDTLEVKLIDFGCGSVLREAAYVTYWGTKVFCPPEFFEIGRYHAKPATVFSLGVLLFVMVFGYYPSPRDLLMISQDEWRKPNLSRECYKFINDSLRLDQEERLVLEEMRLHDWFKVLKATESDV